MNTPTVYLKHIGTQPGFAHLPARELYNVVAGPDCVRVGSTVCRETMEGYGFKVVIVDHIVDRNEMVKP